MVGTIKDEYKLVIKVDDMEEIAKDIKDVDEMLANPMFRALAMKSAQEWIDGNPVADRVKEENPEAYEKYFNAVMYERAAVLLCKKRYC